MTKEQMEENHEESLPVAERLLLHASRLSRAADNLRRAAKIISKGEEITIRLLDENKALRAENEKLKGVGAI